MILRWIGAMLVLGACGWMGFSMANGCIGQVRCLKQLKRGLELMSCQIEYRRTEMPELCEILDAACPGPIGLLFRELGMELRSGNGNDMAAAMALAVERTPELSKEAGGILLELGRSLGKLNLEGELRSLAEASRETSRLLEESEKEQAGRIRSFRALGVCGGAALAILLL